jgi:hypothetical protein
MNELALRVKIVKSQEEFVKTSLQQLQGESVNWVAEDEVLPAVPQWLQDKAGVVAAVAMEDKAIQGLSYEAVAPMRRVSFAYKVVVLYFFSSIPIPRVDLQCNIITIAALRISNARNLVDRKAWLL